MKYFGIKSSIGSCQVFVKLNETDDVILKHIVRHSPDGFQWGYGGSGPSDLALSILTDYNNRYGLKGLNINCIYQRFKEDFLITAGRDLSINNEEIEKWLDKMKKEKK